MLSGGLWCYILDTSLIKQATVPSASPVALLSCSFAVIFAAVRIFAATALSKLFYEST